MHTLTLQGTRYCAYLRKLRLKEESDLPKVTHLQVAERKTENWDYTASILICLFLLGGIVFSGHSPYH